MKFGVVLYKETNNIGDDIQSYAASKFLPSIDAVVDREHLEGFSSAEPVAVIMNGWFLYKKWNWPPASSLRPLFVGFHYSNEKYIQDDFLDGIGIDYLKAWGPIGCRDLYTRDLLQRKGVDSFFSGCMTLTLPQMPKTAQSKNICALWMLILPQLTCWRKKREKKA